MVSQAIVPIELEKPLTGSQIIEGVRYTCQSNDTFIYKSKGDKTSYQIGESGNTSLLVSPTVVVNGFELDQQYSGPIYVMMHAWHDPDGMKFQPHIVEDFAARLQARLRGFSLRTKAVPQWPQVIEICVYCESVLLPDGKCKTHAQHVPTRYLRVVPWQAPPGEAQAKTPQA